MRRHRVIPYTKHRPMRNCTEQVLYRMTDEEMEVRKMKRRNKKQQTIAVVIVVILVAAMLFSLIPAFLL